MPFLTRTRCISLVTPTCWQQAIEPSQRKPEDLLLCVSGPFYWSVACRHFETHRHTWTSALIFPLSMDPAILKALLQTNTKNWVTTTTRISSQMNSNLKKHVQKDLDCQRWLHASYLCRSATMQQRKPEKFPGKHILLHCLRKRKGHS